jgi:hypothetical protein
VLGDGDLFTTPVGEAHVGDFVISLGSGQSCHVVLVQSVEVFVNAWLAIAVPAVPNEANVGRCLLSIYKSGYVDIILGLVEWRQS